MDASATRPLRPPRGWDRRSWRVRWRFVQRLAAASACPKPSAHLSSHRCERLEQPPPAPSGTTARRTRAKVTTSVDSARRPSFAFLVGLAHVRRPSPATPHRRRSCHASVSCCDSARAARPRSRDLRSGGDNGDRDVCPAKLAVPSPSQGGRGSRDRLRSWSELECRHYCMVSTGSI